MDRRKILIVIFALLIIALTTALFHLTRAFYKNYSLGMRHFQKSDYSRALDFFQRALNEKPGSPEALIYAARSHLELGEDDEAAGMLEALAKSPRAKADHLEEAADYYYGMGRYGEAEQLYRIVLKKEPGTRPKRKLTETLAWQGKYDEAADLIGALLEEDPGDPHLVELAADIYSWSGRYSRAAELYRELLDAGYRERETAFKLAETLRLLQKYEEAIRLYEKYLED